MCCDVLLFHRSHSMLDIQLKQFVSSHKNLIFPNVSVTELLLYLTYINSNAWEITANETNKQTNNWIVWISAQSKRAKKNRRNAIFYSKKKINGIQNCLYRMSVGLCSSHLSNVIHLPCCGVCLAANFVFFCLNSCKYLLSFSFDLRCNRHVFLLSYFLSFQILTV